MLETTLLTGPFDWDATLMPREEFEARIVEVRTMLRERGLAGLVVGGTSPEHGALGYLTSFVPKLGPALAFMPMDGDMRIVFSGGPAMLPSARRLMFVEDVRGLRDAERDFADWLGETKGTQFALWGEYAITADVREALERAAPSPLVVLDDVFDPLRRRKSERELVLIRRACAILNTAREKFRAAIAEHKGVRTAALAAERAAYRQGAQDFRVLASLRDGGTPEPMQAALDPHVDPLLACFAVRFAGYWAEGLFTITAMPNDALAAAKQSLAALVKLIRPGALPLGAIQQATKAPGNHYPHPCAQRNFGNGIGLSRDEPPFLSFEKPEELREGDVCSIRDGVGAYEPTGNVIVSAMVRVTADGAEILFM